MKHILQFFGILLVMLHPSCHARDVTVERDVSFGQADGELLLLDIFRPTLATASPRPAVIFIHGGGWGSGGKEDYTDAAMKLVRQGYVTASINYRLVKQGRNRWPAQLDDAQRAVRWLRANAGKHGIDPQRIGALGYSAGGHLAACLGTRETRDNSDPALASHSSRVTCVVDMSGPSDLTEQASAPGDRLVHALLGGTPAEQSAAARDASPLHWVDVKSAPFLIIHGRLDDLVPPRQGERLAAALRNAGVESQLLVFEDEGHGFTKKENTDHMIRKTLAFLQTHLSP
ncbi:alpha/beta hydrolase [Geminisphaera colitermitum]|uniref:alpha/beta hydrolase n=1 Tax=Geminisphaera colitermitum TaxID=1148786 RepID=UPI000158D4A1|nr:alpha/beta hydrolase [Geminisphaera colitermitum]